MRSAAVVAILSACSKGLVGEYTGTLDETCSITRTTDVQVGAGGQLTGTVTRCGGGGAKQGFVLHVAKGAAKDKLALELEGCKLVMTDKDAHATVDPGQTCTLNVTGYSGKTAVDGTMSMNGESVHLTIDFVASDPMTSGAYVVDFTGSRTK